MSKVKTKVVIMKPNRQTRSIILKNKQLKGEVFRDGETTYVIDADRFILTYGRGRLGEKEVYTTYYYREGAPKPLPVPTFPEYENLGVSSAELRAIFEPWFYRTIAPQEESWAERAIKFANVASVFLLLYLIYQLSRIQSQVSELLGALGIGG